MNLDKIINVLDYISVDNYKDVSIGGIAYHSAKVKDGDIFVCIVGHASDGHLYAKDAIKRGAKALVVEAFLSDILVPQIKVKNSRRALANLSAHYYKYPSNSMTMVGVTGTNGKTSTSFFIDQILDKAYKNTGLIGTVVIKNGSKVVPAELTTPESLDLQKYLYEMKENDSRYVTMEVSSSGLDLNRVDFVDYNIAVVNNISRDHIDLHGSFENYVNAKKKLVRGLKEDGYAILNGDCPDSLDFGKETKGKIITFGFKNRLSSIVAENVDLSKGTTTYTLNINEPIGTTDPQSLDIELQVLGLHNVYNSMVAATVALILGVDTRTIKEALYQFTGVERRFQLIYNKDFKIIDDHFANPGNIKVTLDTIKKMNFNNLKLVYGVRGCRGVTVNSENAEEIASYKDDLGLDHIVLTTSTDYVGHKDTVTTNELECVREIFHNAGIKTTTYKLLQDAITNTMDTVENDSLILLGGCQGMDYAAKVSLEYLYKKAVNENILSDKDLQRLKDDLFSPLKNRVAGV